jgi:hypothetical protein
MCTHLVEQTMFSNATNSLNTLCACCIVRLQARLAGPVADLLQAHGQSVDFNLLALAEALVPHFYYTIFQNLV